MNTRFRLFLLHKLLQHVITAEVRLYSTTTKIRSSHPHLRRICHRNQPEPVQLVPQQQHNQPISIFRTSKTTSTSTVYTQFAAAAAFLVRLAPYQLNQLLQRSIKSSSGGDGKKSSQRRKEWLSLLAFLPAAFFGLWKTEEDEMSVEDKILMDIKRAILSIQRDQIEKAEQYLSKALARSQEEQLDHAISQILDIQANLALQKGELGKAEHLLKLVAQRLIGLQGVARDDNAIIEMSIKLAQIYEKTGFLDKAMSGYEYCIKAQKEKIKNNQIGADDEDQQQLMIDSLLLLAWASHSLAQIHMKFAISPQTEEADRNEHMKTATTLSDEAYQYTVQAEGPESEHAITIRSDLATMKALTGDIEGALQTLQEVEGIAKEKYAELYPSISVNIGNLYIEKGSYIEAEKICQGAKLFAGKISDMESFARAQECIRKCALMQSREKEASSNNLSKEESQAQAQEQK